MKKEFFKKVSAKLRKDAIDPSQSKEIAEDLSNIHDIKKRNEMLQKIIQERSMDKEEIQELMYDLTHTHQMLNLKKPQASVKIAEEKDKPEILFKIKTLDLILKGNGEKKEIKGGHIYNVIAFEKGKYYVTDKEYKPGVPQLIPWSIAVELK